MGNKSLAERKQEALNHLNSVMQHLEKIPKDVWLQHLDVFTPVLKDLVALRWVLGQIDKESGKLNKKWP